MLRWRLQRRRCALVRVTLRYYATIPGFMAAMSDITCHLKNFVAAFKEAAVDFHEKIGSLTRLLTQRITEFEDRLRFLVF